MRVETVVKARDLGTYHVRVEFADGRGWIAEFGTGGRYTDGTDLVHPLSASRIDPCWSSEADVVQTILWQYTEGNYGCDCNRDITHGLEPGNWDSDDWTCAGCNRYLVIGCSAPGYTFREMNPGYPDELLAEHEGRWRTLPPGPYVTHGVSP